MTLIKKLTLREVINVLAEYDLEHSKFPHNYMAEVGFDIPIVRGLAMADKRLILIDKEQGEEDLRETVIHELIHCKHYQIGDLRKGIEKHVEKETKLTYNLLYNVK